MERAYTCIYHCHVRGPAQQSRIPYLRFRRREEERREDPAIVTSVQNSTVRAIDITVSAVPLYSSVSKTINSIPFRRQAPDWIEGVRGWARDGVPRSIQ